MKSFGNPKFDRTRECPNLSCIHSVIFNFSGVAGLNEASKANRCNEARIKRQKGCEHALARIADERFLTVVFTYCPPGSPSSAQHPLSPPTLARGQRQRRLGEPSQPLDTEEDSFQGPLLSSAGFIGSLNSLQNRCVAHGCFSGSESSREGPQCPS